MSRGPGEVVVGVDVGTTATKVVGFGLGDPWRYTAVREYPLERPHPGWHVQDPLRVRGAVEHALAECVAAAPLGTRVVGLSLSTAMHGLVGLDADLDALTPVLTWADGRSAAQARELRDGALAAAVHRRTGTPVHPMTPLTKLMWLARHDPGLAARARWWAGLKDWAVAGLTGRLVTELSSASGTAMLDVRERAWDPLAVDLAGIRVDQLPEVVATTTVLPLAPDVAARVGLPAGTPVVVGAGDGPLATLGVGATAPGVVGLSVGTSGAVRTLAPGPTTDPDGRLFCYALTDDTWVVGGAVSNGGSVLRWVRDLVLPDAGPGPGERDAELLRLAEDVPVGSDGLVLLPYLLPERAPLWDPDVPGALLGLRAGHTRGHVVRAAVEGVALQLAAVVDALAGIAPVHAVRATGGVFRAPLWRHVVAAALGRPLTMSGGVEGTATGAAALGLHALGRASDPLTGLGLLAPPGACAHGTSEPVDPADVATYAGLRAALPALVATFATAADALTPSVTTGTGNTWQPVATAPVGLRE
ncbi:gluconokinase [Aquipuribacter nitratireducens]|uniref:Gluconokinase n=1 Tax=Aquipuribacter nitratireducens TaxID=650104 RepID=A0ABW0GQV5_9MICO